VNGRKIIVCSCEASMPDFGHSVARACQGAGVETGRQFCGGELDRLRAAISDAEAVTIGCTQQAPLFTEVAAELGFGGDLVFANIRETAGWSDQAAAAGPKAAALLAMASERTQPPRLVTLSSRGVILIYGCDVTAIEAGTKLAGKLDVTVLLSRPRDVAPHRRWEFPVMQGTIRNAKGHLGAFEMIVDDFAAPATSSRARLRFGESRDGAVSHADIVLDLSGGMPLFPAHELRDGYVRAEPGDRVAVAEAIWQAADLVGEFDKPLYVDFAADLCAHSRSSITGCTRCLDLCPTGAIAPAGDHVAIDAEVCAGCGNCAAACPTGAAEYAVPGTEALLTRLRALLLAYRRAGGTDPIVLFHDIGHGDPVIDALARFGRGLPANVLPVGVNQVTQLGLEAWTAPLAWGGSLVRALVPARPRHERAGLAANIATANLLAHALGYGEQACGLIETDDPDDLAASLAGESPVSSSHPASFLPLGRKRSVLESTMLELHRAAPSPADKIPLPAGAPFGGIAVDVEGCTLCLSCVTACPTGALSHGEDRPALHFSEGACVQCGLCAATCPEKVIALVPQIDFQAWKAPRRTIKEEEPFRCIRCGTPFGTRSSMERVVARLEGRHWMFSGQNAGRLEALRMCDRCRIEAVTNEGLDPHAGPRRPKPRTTEYYLRARQDGDDPDRDS
jgi:ferredoxin